MTLQFRPFVAALLLSLGAGLLAFTGPLAHGALASPDTANTLIFDCGPIGEAHADPFADELGVTDVHRHFFRENRASEVYGADVTEEQLKSSLDTTCGPSWATSLQWNPMTRDPANGVHAQSRQTTIVYIRDGVASPSNLRHIPDGAKMLASNNRMTFICVPGDQSTVTRTPPYGCESTVIRIRPKFPQCWDELGKNPQNFVYPVSGRCPSGTVPIPEISYAIALYTPNPLASPFEVSAGHDTWKDYTSFHADLWATYQQDDPTPDGGIHPPEGFKEAVEACVMKDEDAPRPSYCLHPDSHDL